MSIPYDPDFDTPSVSVSSSDIMNRLTARSAFVAGVVTAVLLVGTIGFFVLLFIVLNLRS